MAKGTVYAKVFLMGELYAQYSKTRSQEKRRQLRLRLFILSSRVKGAIRLLDRKLLLDMEHPLKKRSNKVKARR